MTITDTHVYCTDCIFGKEVIDRIKKDKSIPESCDGCWHYHPEDSFPNYLRPNYVPIAE